MKQRKEKTMRKIISFMLVLIMMAVPFTFTATALACDGDVSFRDDLGGGVQTMAATDSELLSMKAYLERQYNSTLSGSLAVSENMGYLFALKGIQYAIEKTPYGSGGGKVDCSKLTYTALKDSYTQKGLSSYYIFGSSKKASQAQYNICKQNGLTGAITSEENAGILKTGDLLFWRVPGTNESDVNHVGIYLRYNSENYIIETGRSTGHAYVSEGFWGVSELQNPNYEMFAYARVNKANIATFKTGSPFNESLGTQRVLFNCPPSPPTPPTHTNYVFTGWSPSVTAGMTANTTYIANYYQRIDKSLK